MIRFDGSPPAIKKVLDRLHQAGCPVDYSGGAWLDATRFAGLSAYERGPDTRHAEIDRLDCQLQATELFSAAYRFAPELVPGQLAGICAALERAVAVGRAAVEASRKGHFGQAACLSNLPGIPGQALPSPVRLPLLASSSRTARLSPGSAGRQQIRALQRCAFSFSG